MPDDDFLQLESVRLSADGAAEMDGTRRLVFVPRAEIERLELRHGSGSERPIVTAVLGVALLVLSGVPIWMLMNALRGHGTFEIKFMTAVAFAIPALWLLDLSIRRRWMIVVHARKDTRKLVFHEMNDRVEIERFFTEARSRFGYGG
jgi:hypothetical protein